MAKPGPRWILVEAPARRPLWERMVGVWVLGMLGIIGAVIVAGVFHTAGEEVAEHRQHQDLRRHGVIGDAVVVRTRKIPGGENSQESYEVTVLAAVCSCTVTRPIETLAGHPVESTIPIRYDPARPRDFELLADRRDGDMLAVVALSFAAPGGAIAGSVSACKAWRRRRRVAGMCLERNVTFEPWQRAVGTGEGEKRRRYLVLYDVADVVRGDPLWCVRASRKALRTINRHALSDQTLDLWAPPVPSPFLMLRKGDIVVLPPTKRKRGTWEAELRIPGRRAATLPSAGGGRSGRSLD